MKGTDLFGMPNITSLDSLNECVTKAVEGFDGRQVWFRGQRNQEWHLHATIFRERDHPRLPRLLNFDEKKEQEREIANTFRQRAPLRRESCPKNDDDFGWLALMRHYLAACRLLDWSQSALVGLYCAVEEELDKKDNTDSRLWFLSPAGLIRSTLLTAGGQPIQEQGSPLTPDHELVAGRARAAFDEYARIRPMSKSPAAADEVRTKSRKVAGRPIAVVPSENNNRMLVQSSVFTLQSDSQPLDGCEFTEPVVCSTVIPKDSRASLRATLNNLGINRNFLFPDLEDLAKWLNHAVMGRANPIGD